MLKSLYINSVIFCSLARIIKDKASNKILNENGKYVTECIFDDFFKIKNFIKEYFYLFCPLLNIYITIKKSMMSEKDFCDKRLNYLIENKMISSNPNDRKVDLIDKLIIYFSNFFGLMKNTPIRIKNSINETKKSVEEKVNNAKVNVIEKAEKTKNKKNNDNFKIVDDCFYESNSLSNLLKYIENTESKDEILRINRIVRNKRKSLVLLFDKIRCGSKDIEKLREIRNMVSNCDLIIKELNNRYVLLNQSAVSRIQRR